VDLRAKILLGAAGLVIVAGLVAASAIEVCACGPRTTVLGAAMESAASFLGVAYKASRRPI
jgi:hypothetical protein